MAGKTAAQSAPGDTGKARFFELAEKAGLVGCLNGPPDLAQRLKRYLKLKPRAGKKTAP